MLGMYCMCCRYCLLLADAADAIMEAQSALPSDKPLKCGGGGRRGRHGTVTFCGRLDSPEIRLFSYYRFE
jgi:hypothetical protein